MALANGDKAAICSVIVAVAVVLGLIAYDPYYTKGVAEVPSASHSNSAPAASETNATTTADAVAISAAQNATTAAATTAAATTPIVLATTESQTAEKESADVNDGLSVAAVVSATVVVPGPANPDATAEPETLAPASPLLDCSVPSSIPQDSQLGWSSILLDHGLQPLAGKTISWQISPGGRSFTAVTQADGTATAAVNLIGISPGIYNVTAALDGNPGNATVSCTQSFEIVHTTSSSSGGRTFTVAQEGSAADAEGPGLKITAPIDGQQIPGSSFGVPVRVEGTASDASNMASVEVRWTANWGLTGYRIATPAGQNDWSTWSYDGIKFDTQGEKKILVKATDVAGNKSWKVVTFSILFASDKITTNITDGQAIPGTGSGDATLHLTGTATKFDPAGVQKVEVRTDLSGYNPAVPDAPGDWSAWSYDVTFPTSGSHQVIVRVTDNAGTAYWLVTNVTVQPAP